MTTHDPVPPVEYPRWVHKPGGVTKKVENADELAQAVKEGWTKSAVPVSVPTWPQLTVTAPPAPKK